MSESGKNTNCLSVFLLSVLPLLVLTMLISCSREQAGKVKIPGNNAGSGKKNVMTAKVKDFQVRLERMLKPISYHYDPMGKPDPFQPFIKSFQPVSSGRNSKVGKGMNGRPRHCTTPLECMDVGQLTLVAVVMRDEGGPLAMVQDAAGLGYVLRVGARVGYQNGRVVKISPNTVVVAEEAEDLMGRKVTRKRILSLHSEE